MMTGRSTQQVQHKPWQPRRWGECWIFFISIVAVSTESSSAAGRKPLSRLRPRQQSPLHQRPPSSKTTRVDIASVHGSQKEGEDLLLSHKLKSRGGSAAVAVPLLATTGTTCTTSLSQSIRVALAGGIAGAVGTALLYPMDAAKTLRQSNPSRYTSVRHALFDLILSGSPRKATSAASAAAASAWGATAASHLSRPRAWADALWHRLTITKAYRGVLPATLGAIPSSALYFGAYEACKNYLQRQSVFRVQGDTANAVSKSYRNRLMVHALAAASGNALSSIVFVPKEVIKNQMQYQHAIAATQVATSTNAGWTAIVAQIVRTKGIGGLYCGYQATLLRNIPSAILRFCIYEELKWAWHTSRLSQQQSLPQEQKRLSQVPREIAPALSLKFFLAGAVAGALASGLMTPLDVVKTRLATGTCPLDVQPCFWHVLRQDGWSGLYAGAGSRMLWSGAFSAIGFGTFEWAKSLLGVGVNECTGGTAPKRLLT